MVVTSSNNMITTMIGGVAEAVAHAVVEGGAMAIVEVEVLMILRNHHQVRMHIGTKSIVQWENFMNFEIFVGYFRSVLILFTN